MTDRERHFNHDLQGVICDGCEDFYIDAWRLAEEAEIDNSKKMLVRMARFGISTDIDEQLTEINAY